MVDKNGLILPRRKCYLRTVAVQSLDLYKKKCGLIKFCSFSCYDLWHVTYKSNCLDKEQNFLNILSMLTHSVPVKWFLQIMSNSCCGSIHSSQMGKHSAVQYRVFIKLFFFFSEIKERGRQFIGVLWGFLKVIQSNAVTSVDYFSLSACMVRWYTVLLKTLICESWILVGLSTNILNSSIQSNFKEKHIWLLHEKNRYLNVSKQCFCFYFVLFF